MIQLIRAEYRKYFREIKYYYPDQIVDIIIKYILFIGFFYGLRGGELNASTFFAGYLFWMIASYIISEASISISFEKQVGTIEQLLIKPISSEIILIIRTLVLFSVSIIKFVLLFIIILLTTNISIEFDTSVVLLSIISLLGFLGLGIGLSGLTMIFAKTASFESIISYMLLLLSGSIISYNNMPNWFMNLIKYWPFVLQIDMAQRILSGRLVRNYEWMMIVILNILILLIGCIFYKLCYRIVQKNGVANKY